MGAGRQITAVSELCSLPQQTLALPGAPGKGFPAAGPLPGHQGLLPYPNRKIPASLRHLLKREPLPPAPTLGLSFTLKGQDAHRAGGWMSWGRPAPGRGCLWTGPPPKHPTDSESQGQAPVSCPARSWWPCPPSALSSGCATAGGRRVKERASPCQATQAVPFYGHAAAGGAGEPRLGSVDLRSRSRARTQLFPSPAPCGVAGRLLGAPSLGHDSLPSSAASGGSYPAPPGYPRQPRVGTRTLTPTDPSCPPRTQFHGPRQGSP